MALIITLIVIGIMLLAIELLITPGFGLPGILGLLSVVGSIALAFVEYGQTTGLIILAIVILTLSFFTWLFLRSKTWKKISLSESISSKANTTPQEDGLDVGVKGHTISRLAPSGKARFGHLDCEVWSISGIIDSGSSIEIAYIEGNKIIVQPSVEKHTEE